MLAVIAALVSVLSGPVGAISAASMIVVLPHECKSSTAIETNNVPSDRTSHMTLTRPNDYELWPDLGRVAHWEALPDRSAGAKPA
jgi:hypothetical protein